MNYNQSIQETEMIKIIDEITLKSIFISLLIILKKVLKSFMNENFEKTTKAILVSNSKHLN